MANITVPGLPAKTGTILDAAYLHLNESSVDKKVTIAQLLAKIEAQYSADIVTLLGSANKAEGRANLSIDRRVTVDNANYTILATDKVVAQIGTMSAARTFSLPAASTVQAGAEIIVIDESGSVDSTNKIIVQRNGTDVIDGQTSVDMVKGYGVIKLICDGSNSWKISGSMDNIVQIVNTQTGVVATGATIIPEDNTKPQNTEGDEYMTLAITPTNASNKLKIDVVFHGTHSVAALLIVALFQDSTADSLATSAQVVPSLAWQQNITFSYEMPAGTTSTTTFKVRAGASSAGTTTFNGSIGAAKFNGTYASSITITEIKI